MKSQKSGECNECSTWWPWRERIKFSLIKPRGDWISVQAHLPLADEWVQVYEDDDDNPQEAFIGKLYHGKVRKRVTPARLLNVDREGYPIWYLCYVGGGPVCHVRNVTYWRPLSAPPDLSCLQASQGVIQ